MYATRTDKTGQAAAIKKWRGWLRQLGPGLITGAADDDPSGIATGIVAPPILLVMMLLARNRRVMGTFTIRPLASWLGWIATAVMAAAVLAMFVV